MRIIIIILLIISFELTVNAQSYKDMIDSVNNSISNQDFPSALIWAEKALTFAENNSGKNDTNYISIIKKLVEINFTLNKFDDALQYAKIDSEKTQSVYGENNLQYADALLNLTQIYINIKKLSDAENVAVKSTDLYKNLLSQYDPKYADALNILAWIYTAENKGSEASGTYYKVLKIIGENYGILHDSYAETVAKLTKSLESKQLFKDAEAFLLNTIRDYKDANGMKSKNYALACFDLGRIYIESGRELESEPFIKEGLQILTPAMGENNQVIMNNLYLLALDYSLTNKYSESEALFKKVLNYHRKVSGENSVEFASLLNRLAMLYRTMNRFYEAEELCKQSIDILKNLKMEKSYLYSVLLNSLAEIYLNTGRFDNCTELYNECDKISKSIYGENYPDKDMLLNNRAELLKNMGKYKESESLFQKALNILEKKSGKNNARYAWFLNNLAEVLEFEGYYGIADSIYRNVLKLRKDFRGEFHPEYAETVGFLARLNENKGDSSKSDKYFIEALDIYLHNINLTFPALSESEKSYFIAPIKSFFEHFCSYVSKRANTNPSTVSDLFNYRMKTKSLLFNSTKKVHENILKSRDSALINKYNLWLVLRDELARYYNLSDDILIKKGIKLDSINLTANEIEKELSESCVEFGNEYEKKDCSWEEIRNALESNEAAIELIRFRLYDNIKNSFNPSVHIPGFLDSVIYAALIITKETKQNPLMILIRNGNQFEKSIAKLYESTIKKAKDDFNSGFDSTHNRETEKELSYIYDIMWKDITSQLKGIRTIYLSPDGIYNKINFNTLFNSETKHYVIDDKDIRIVTNMTDIIDMKSSHLSDIKSAYLFGNPEFNLSPDSVAELAKVYNPSRTSDLYDLSSDAKDLVRNGINPLPETEKEVINISGKLKVKDWNVKEFIGSNAIEEAVKAVRNPRVLHLATHGKFLKDVEIDNKRTSGLQTRQFSENPLLRSFLIFAGAGNLFKNSKDVQFADDGFLTAYEAMNLNLDSTELVVLSECETVLGELRNGEGVYGLQRAFGTAGAKTVIMSLWNVSDEPAQELMTTFYDKWLSGETKRDAFRDAQLILKGKYNNVYYWGGFVIVGE